MNEEDRQKIFWLLQKYSSFTAWNALGKAYVEFAKVYEYAIENAEDADEWDFDHLKRVLDGQIAFEKGLPRLREGQRSVFRNTSTGYLGQAADQIVFIERIMGPEEFVFDWMKNNEEVVQATQNLDKKMSGLLLAHSQDLTKSVEDYLAFSDECFYRGRPTEPSAHPPRIRPEWCLRDSRS